MQRTFFALLLAIAAALALGMGVGAVGAVGAQENATNASTGVDASADYEETVGPNVRLVDWEYNGGQFALTFEADEPTRVSITEAGTWEEGSGQFNYVEQVIGEGRSTVTVPVSDRDGAAVGITTPASMDQGTGAYVSIGREEVDQNPLTTFGGESGLFTGVIMTVVLAALSAAYVVRSEESGVIKA